MASGSGISITIKAVDQTTATLAKVNARIAGSQKAINSRLQQAAAPWKRLGGQIQQSVRLLGGARLAQGVERTAKGFMSLSRHSFKTFQNFSRIVDPLSVITGASTIAGITILERRFAQLGQTLTNTGRLMNMDPATLARWQGAVRLTGGSAGDATSSLRGLEYAATDARFGMNNQAASFLQLSEGANWRQQSKDLNGTTLALSRYISTLHGSARANAIRNIQGSFGFTDGFMAMLLRGPKAVQGLLGEAAAHGSPTDKQIGAGNSLAGSLNGLQQSLEGLATAVTSKLAPAIQPMVDAFSKWVDKNRQLIAQNITGFVKKFADYMAKVDWKEIWKNIQKVFDTINNVVKSIGGWKTVLIGVIGILTASKVAAIALPFVQLAGAIARLTVGPGSFGALGLALRAAGFGVVGGQLVKLGAEAVGASPGIATVLGDAAGGAIAGGAMFGPVGAAVGGVLGAAYGAYEVHKASKAQEMARAQAMMTYYRSQGLSEVQAAGLVGGFMQESQLDPGANNGSHYGIGQWDASRQADFKRIYGHTMQQGTIQEQMQFALNEMFNGKEGASGKALLAAKTLPEATKAALGYERPADPGTPAWNNEYGWRLANASQVLAASPSGGKYLPAIDPAGNAGAYPSDNEPQHLLGITQPGAGMGAENRLAIDVTVNHAGNVTGVKARHSSAHTIIRTMSPLPAGAP